MSVSFVLRTALASALLSAVACGSDDSNSGFEESSSSGGASSGNGNGFGNGSSGGGTDTDAGPPECVATEAQATLSKRPVDIVFAIDNSRSMSVEIEEVEKQVNQNFANLIGASGIDYRVVMLSLHGDHDDQKVCISAPLASGSCDPLPAQPLESARFFHHSAEVDSHIALCAVLRNFDRKDEMDRHPNGYSEFLRADAFKVFVVISDDDVETSCKGETFDDRSRVSDGEDVAARFDAKLLELSPEQFGAVAARNYLWHSIIGLAPYDDANRTLAHPPEAPIVTAQCAETSKSPGTGYQALSKLTGGLRYPSCELDYTTIFQSIAAGIIEGAKIACEVPIPAPPPGQTLDLSTVVVRFTPNGSATQQFTQVAAAAACTDGAFYIEADQIMLCPGACNAVNAGPGDFKIAYGCKADGPR